MNKVICNSIGSPGCDHLCGARKPHYHDSCEPCPWIKDAKCIEIEDNKHFINN